MTNVKLHGTLTRLSGIFLNIGDTAPDFLLVDQDLKDRSLKDFPGKRLLIIVPSLDTPICSISSKKFSEQIKNKTDLVMLIISADLPFAQKRYCGAEGIANATTLSMMRNKSFGKDYGVLIQEGPLAGVCCRAVLLLDAQGKILYTELVDEITTEPNYDKILSLL